MWLTADTGHGWVWQASSNQWVDVGAIASQVPGPTGPAGPAGATGPAGPQGIPGPIDNPTDVGAWGRLMDGTWQPVMPLWGTVNIGDPTSESGTNFLTLVTTNDNILNVTGDGGIETSYLEVRNFARSPQLEITDWASINTLMIQPPTATPGPILFQVGPGAVGSAPGAEMNVPLVMNADLTITQGNALSVFGQLNVPNLQAAPGNNMTGSTTPGTLQPLIQIFKPTGSGTAKALSIENFSTGDSVFIHSGGNPRVVIGPDGPITLYRPDSTPAVLINASGVTANNTGAVDINSTGSDLSGNAVNALMIRNNTTQHFVLKNDGGVTLSPAAVTAFRAALGI